jgi:hypothetical protein
MKSTTTKILTFLFIITLLSSCNVNMLNRVNGNKNVVTEDRTTKEAFTTIKVSSGLDLFISQGSKNKIIVEADENLQEIIITEVKNGLLKIYTEKNIWRAKARKIYVTVKDLETLTATSGAEVYAKESLKVNNLRISATSGAEINISVDANTVETNATSGADIEISGIANNYITNATSGASIDAYELHSKNVTAKVTSGGDIDFKGNPKKVDKKSTSGGSISAE